MTSNLRNKKFTLKDEERAKQPHYPTNQETVKDQIVLAQKEPFTQSTQSLNVLRYEQRRTF